MPRMSKEMRIQADMDEIYYAYVVDERPSALRGVAPLAENIWEQPFRNPKEACDEKRTDIFIHDTL